MSLNNQFYFSSPVEVVKVTAKNLEEVAEWCGGKIGRKESLKVNGRVDSYVEVPTPKGAPISWAFPGMFITKRLAVTEKDEIKASFSVFRKDYFSKNYFSQIKDAVDNTWERHESEKKAAALMDQAIKRGHITINISGVKDISEIAGRVEEALGEEPADVVINQFIYGGNPAEEVVLSDMESDQAAGIPEPMHEQRVAVREEAVEAEAQ